MFSNSIYNFTGKLANNLKKKLSVNYNIYDLKFLRYFKNIVFLRNSKKYIMK